MRQAESRFLMTLCNNLDVEDQKEQGAAADLEAQVVSRGEARHILHQTLRVKLSAHKGAGSVLPGEEGVAATGTVVGGAFAHVVDLEKDDI